MVRMPPRLGVSRDESGGLDAEGSGGGQAREVRRAASLRAELERSVDLALLAFPEGFPVQSLVIEDVLAGARRPRPVPHRVGQDVRLRGTDAPIASAQAGHGRPDALILAPTRELAAQIVDELDSVAELPARSRSRPSTAASASAPRSSAARKAHIVVATPGRLEDLIDRGDLSLDRVRILVLDEADRMLDMGFKPAVDRIVADAPRKRQTLFFSATLEGAAGKVAAAYTSDARRHVHGRSVERRAGGQPPLRPGRLAGRQARRPDRRAARRPGAAAPWSSSGPSAAPTGWSSALAPRTSPRSRCTATSPSPSARRRWPASSAATWTC